MVSKDFFDVKTWYVQNEDVLKENAVQASPIIPEKPSALDGKQSAFGKNFFSTKKEEPQKKKSFIRKMLDL